MSTNSQQAALTAVRPTPIPGSHTLHLAARQPGERFTWGPVVKEHEVGPDIVIIEYLDDRSNYNHARDWLAHGRTMYHAWSRNIHLSHSFTDFDEAVVFAIASNRTRALNGPSYLVSHFIKGLDSLKEG